MVDTRWLTRALLVLAGLLALWVLLLAFGDPKFGAVDVTPSFVFTATAGVGGAAALATLLTAWSLWRQRTPVIVMLVCSALLVVSTELHLLLGPLGSAGVGVVGVLGIALCGPPAFRWVGRPSASETKGHRGRAVGLVAVGMVLAVTSLVALLQPVGAVFDVGTDTFWVVLDLTELAALAATGWGLIDSKPRLLVAAGTVAATIFLADAWFSAALSSDVLGKGLSFDALGVLPSAALCAYAASVGWQHSHSGSPQLTKDVV